MLESQRLYDEMLRLLNEGRHDEAKVPAAELKAILDKLEDYAWFGDLSLDQLPQGKTNFSIVAKQHLLLTTLCQRVLRGRLDGEKQ